jgi:hypothetical protein
MKVTISKTDVILDILITGNNSLVIDNIVCRLDAANAVVVPNIMIVARLS